MDNANLASRLAAAYPDFSITNLFEDTAHKLGCGLSWRRVRFTLKSKEGESAGLCVNALKFSAKSLRPFPIKFGEQSREALLQDADLQRSFASAYWYTTWAEGALRGAGRETSPVAFWPVVRSKAFRKSRNVTAEDFLEIEKGYWLVGQDILELRQIREKVETGKIRWRDGQFFGEVSASILAKLNQKAFIDRYIGKNSEPSNNYAPRKLIPVNGSHLISRLLNDEWSGFENGSLLNKIAAVAAATNGGFFLNFPEEYVHNLSAMNDPVGLLMQDGQIEQLPLALRSALLVRRSGQARIAVVGLEDFELRLPWRREWQRNRQDDGFVVNKEDLAGKSNVVYTPFFNAQKPPGEQRTPPAESIDLAVVFGEIAEVKLGGRLEIPPNGIVLSLPMSEISLSNALKKIEEFGGNVAFRPAQSISPKDDPLVTAIGAGPLLVNQQGIVSDDFFEKECTEEFLGMDSQSGNIVVNGAAPTRFPHDSAQTRAPRTVLGLLDDREALILVIDGRNSEHSIGATLVEAARIAQAFNCRQALNLDGGGSSVLFLKSKIAKKVKIKSEIKTGIVNLPSDPGGCDRLMPVPLFISGANKIQEEVQ